MSLTNQWDAAENLSFLFQQLMQPELSCRRRPPVHSQRLMQLHRDGAPVPKKQMEKQNVTDIDKIKINQQLSQKEEEESLFSKIYELRQQKFNLHRASSSRPE